MNFARLARIPTRIADDLKIISLTRNWQELLSAKRAGAPFLSVRLRNGVVLDAPVEASLNFLFHEIWIDEIYAPSGYEIKQDDIVVDIGANIGVFSTWAATRHPTVKVISFEPFPENAVQFRSNLRASRLRNVEFQEAAVGASDGKRSLEISDSWILHSLADTHVDVGIEVDCISLDSAFAVLDRCDLLKLDCEGGEYEILYSASAATMSKIMRLVCEFNIIDSERRNGSGLLEFLRDRGFHVDRLEPLNESSGFICARKV